MPLKKTLKMLIALCLFGQIATAQNTTNIPLNKDVKYGKLSNGLTYYVLHNAYPKERANFYFVQNVGAILEEDSQNGLAHFLEHMAFNGLEHFPGKSMLNYLSANGMKMGGEVNARTGQEETTYLISNVPTSNQNLMDSVLLVLHDWSGGLLLEAEEIEAERGVIQEEYRARADARFRMSKIHWPVLFNNSKHAYRNVIGSMDVVANFEHKELRNYYEKWYRTDLQAVIVVGDFDADKMEEKVKELFSKIPAKKNPAPREFIRIEDTQEMGYALATDKEARGTSLSWYFKKPAVTLRDNNYVNQSLRRNMFINLLNGRLAEKRQEAETPVQYVQIGSGELGRTKSHNNISIMPKENRIIEAFEMALSEVERVRQHGFTSSELERVKKQFAASYQNYLKGKERITHEDWNKKLQAHFTKAEPAPSVEWIVENGLKVIAETKLDDLNAFVKAYDNINNSAIIITGPDKEGLTYPTKAELQASIEKVQSTKLEPYKDMVSDAPLVPEKLTEAKIVSQEPIEGFDATLYVLENGAKVAIMPSVLSKNQILFSGSSFGGLSKISREDLESAQVLSRMLQQLGVGEYNTMQLHKKLSGKKVKVSLNLNEFFESVSGSSSPDDFETMMQLAYMYFEHPNVDKNTYQKQLENYERQLKMASTNNTMALNDTLSMMTTNYHERTLLLNRDYINNLNFEKAKKVYKDRFTDASDFTFVFVGNIEKEKHLPLIQKYIGNIKSENRKETWEDNGVRMAQGHTTNIFEREMASPKTSVVLNVRNEIKNNLLNETYTHIVADLLAKRYHQTVREEEGGTYGVSVSPKVNKRPYEHAGLNIKFSCSPDKQEHLRTLIHKELEVIAKEVNASNLAEIKKNYIKNKEDQMKSVGGWRFMLVDKLVDNKPMVTLDEYKQMIDDIDAKEVAKFAKKLLKKADMVEVIMNPESN